LKQDAAQEKMNDYAIRLCSEDEATPQLSRQGSAMQISIPDIKVEAPNEKLEQIEPVESFIETKEMESLPVQESEEVAEASPKVATSSKKRTGKAKTTEFAYLLERKSFRMMRKYYKETFEFQVEDPDYKKKLPHMSAEELNAHVSKYLTKELGNALNMLSDSDFSRTRDGLKTIILCDRYKKKEKISEGLSFVSFRNVLHKYNTRNLIEFLSDASFSLLFTHFFLKNGKQATQEQNEVNGDKLIGRMRHLMKEASGYLPSSLNNYFEGVYSSVYSIPTN
jgi:hypothetical protein